MSFVVSRSPAGSAASPTAEPRISVESTLGRTCLAIAFSVVTLCLVLKSSGAETPWMGGLLGLSAGLVSAYVVLGWQEFTDDLARHRRHAELRRT
jgi:hypothetical protein